MAHKRSYKPKWGSSDPRAVLRHPRLDPDSGLPPVGKDLPVEKVLRRARAKHAHRRAR